MVIYSAGVSWDGIQGTDHRLVAHLHRHLPVLWIDPPMPVTRVLRPRAGDAPIRPGLHQLDDNLWRLTVVAPPGVARLGLHLIARTAVEASARLACRRLGATTTVALVANPDQLLSRLPGQHRLFFATDDFVAGARLLGVDDRRLQRIWSANTAAADVVLAVSPALVATLGGPSRRVRLLPNGCSPDRYPPTTIPYDIPIPRPVAGVVGQLNERLDVDLLLQVARSGVSLLLVGPRYERDPSVHRRYDNLVGLPNVHWVGRQPFEKLPGYLAAMDLGLTPYADTQFNRSSFPLKTLEYLSAGMRVVSTDLPAARWLQSPLVDVVGSRAEFIQRVQFRLVEGRTPELADECRAAARRHDWRARAAELASIIGSL